MKFNDIVVVGLGVKMLLGVNLIFILLIFIWIVIVVKYGFSRVNYFYSRSRCLINRVNRIVWFS